MAIEGLEPSDFSYEIYKLIVEGKITVDEAMEMIKKYHGVKQ